MNLLHNLLVILFPILSYSMYGEENPHPRVLNLEEAEQIRVLLFSQNPPDSLRFTADSARVRIFSGETEVRFDEISIDLPLAYKDGKVYLETEYSRQQIDSLFIESRSGTRIITEQFGYRYYNGSLIMRPNAVLTGMDIINKVDFEDYIASVIGSEMNFHEPHALKAQAVVSRSYALWSMKQSPNPDFDVLDYESNQMYIGIIRDRPHYNEAASSTAGEILTWSDKLVLAVYSSTCGGITANNENVWSGDPQPYLRMKDDGGMCSISPHYEWNYTLTKKSLQEALNRIYGISFEDIELEKDESGRVSNIRFRDHNGENLSLSGNEFRLSMNREFRPLAIRSTRFNWLESDGLITLEGKGLGHGVGMCQWGAKGFAKNGWTYKDILSFYFSGTKIVNLEDIESNQLPLYQ